ncbi:AAA family ATPase [Streptomyces longwoodensis]|uniref:chloramphenicol phosphotransferase CPT family protein n=1 Tax=Streptomyces longwoodensis TaxID=68231 RepID=UPI002DDB2232|nr:AAA family ATPase [Streptomyces longwoodensis]WRY87308.1 chloramphenicol phosphotransferase CPT family protein [Streptomyces longwoodensis]WUC74566.1 chloramphenicol phosphotransferase CPT family protein [Streptomyces longwoodensis]
MRHLSSVPARRGTIIFLNGTSSSGKSTIAAELTRVLDEPCFHMAVDTFHAMRSRAPVPAERLDDVLHRTWQGFHRAVAGMAAAGNDVVVDHVLSAEWRLRDCLALFDPRDVVFVGVHCPPAELERRERARGDRPTGLAARQLPQVHAHGVYDLECDTAREDATAVAHRIKDFLPRRPSPTAFEKLRGGLRDGTQLRLTAQE